MLVPWVRVPNSDQPAQGESREDANGSDVWMAPGQDSKSVKSLCRGGDVSIIMPRVLLRTLVLEVLEDH